MVSTRRKLSSTAIVSGGLAFGMLTLWFLVRSAATGELERGPAERVEPNAVDLDRPLGGHAVEDRVASPVRARGRAGADGSGPGSRSAALQFQHDSRDGLRTVSVRGEDGKVIGVFSEPTERDPTMRTVEITTGGLALEIDIESGDRSAILVLADGHQVELSDTPEPGARPLPSAYAAHIELLDILQREANSQLAGDAPIELVERAECEAPPIAAEGQCFGDCEDLACQRANANLNRRCSASGGCCKVTECTSSCLRAQTEGGSIRVVCFASQSGVLADAR